MKHFLTTTLATCSTALMAMPVLAAQDASLSLSLSNNLCAKYAESARYMKAIATVAAEMQLSTMDLCALERLGDIHVTPYTYYDPKQDNQAVPHSWVALHYMDYSCQFFVRDADQEITRSNCYSTF